MAILVLFMIPGMIATIVLAPALIYSFIHPGWMLAQKRAKSELWKRADEICK